MRRADTQAALDAALADGRRGGRRVALVPTMGNLHAGHLSLVARARKLADIVVVSIFVNPLQFGPGEDFDRYPRTVEADLAQLEAANVDVAFTPDMDIIYPNGYPPATTVRMSGPLVETLEGAHRPGHFDGVATVVNILFNRVRPDLAVFGEKDYQQLAVIRRMVADFGLAIEIVAQPTARAEDGLALSSRNQYLSETERAAAPQLRAALVAAAQRLQRGDRDFSGIEKEAANRLSAGGFSVQYVAVRAPDLSPPGSTETGFVVLAAAYQGGTRLIDNLVVDAPTGWLEAELALE